MTPSPWRTRDELADRLGLPKATLEWWAHTGKGPRYAKFGRHVRYHIDVIEAWEREQMGEAS